MDFTKIKNILDFLVKFVIGNYYNFKKPFDKSVKFYFNKNRNIKLKKKNGKICNKKLLSFLKNN